MAVVAIGLDVAPAAAAPIAISILSPVEGATIRSEQVAVRGTVGLAGNTARVIYVVDVSGSTASPVDQDCNGDARRDATDDLNNDGTRGDTLDCEIAGVIALNQSLVNRPDLRVGLVAFGSTAAAADVSPSTGVQNFVSPGEDGNDGGFTRDSVADIENTAQSLDQGKVNQFSLYQVGTNTSFDAALSEVNRIVAGSTQPTIIFFLSDGQAAVTSSSGSALAQLKAAGAQINTYGIGAGTGSSPCSAALGTIASSPDRCRVVSDPNKLVAVLPSSTGSTIVKVSLKEGAKTYGPVDATLDAAGGWTAGFNVGASSSRRIFSATATAANAAGESGTTNPRVFGVGSPGLTYAALGDSFSAGEGIDPWIETSVDRACHRSPKAYSQLLMPAGTQTPFVKTPTASVRFAACTGAIMRNFDIAPQSTSNGITNPLQFNSLGPEVDVVTLSIGGNDAGFTEILDHCAFKEDCFNDSYVTLDFGGQRKDYTLEEFLKVRLASILIQLPATYARVRAAVRPDTQIIVAGYPHLLGKEGGCAENVPFPLGEREDLYEIQERFEQGLKTATTDEGVAFASVVSAFKKRIPCSNSSDDPYLNGLDSDWTGGGWKFWNSSVKIDDQSFHPTAKGQEAYAKVIQSALDSGLGGLTVIVPSFKAKVTDSPTWATEMMGVRASAAELAAAATVGLGRLDISSLKEANASDALVDPACNAKASPRQPLLVHGYGFDAGTDLKLTTVVAEAPFGSPVTLKTDSSGESTYVLPAPVGAAGSRVGVALRGRAAGQERILSGSFILDGGSCGAGSPVDKVGITAPASTVLGRPATVTVQVTNNGLGGAGRPVAIRVSRDGATLREFNAISGDDGTFRFDTTATTSGKDTVTASLLIGGVPGPSASTLIDFTGGGSYVLTGGDGASFAPSGVGFVGAAKLAAGGPLRNAQGQLVAPSGRALSAPVIGSAASVGGGQWTALADGTVLPIGKAPVLGDLSAVRLTKPIVGVAGTTDRAGYWLVASDGGVFAFGSARFVGSMGGRPLNKPIVGIVADPDGSGYWLVASDGGVFSFGAIFSGSTGSFRLNAPIVGMTADPDRLGYWLVASDGGVFAFNARFSGSTGDIRLIAPVVGILAAPDGPGYWLAAADGGVFAFAAPFQGSVAASTLNAPVVAIRGS